MTALLVPYGSFCQLCHLRNSGRFERLRCFGRQKGRRQQIPYRQSFIRERNLGVVKNGDVTPSKPG